MNQAIEQSKELINRALLKYQSLDTNPALSKLNINHIIKPSNIALFITFILCIIVLVISPLGIPFLLVCFIIPAKVTLKSYKKWEDNEWVLMFWVWNALMEVVTPIVTLVLPCFLWTLIRIGLAYYLVVMEGGKTVFPTIKQYLQIKSSEVKL